MKRALAILLSVGLLLTCIPINVLAEELPNTIAEQKTTPQAELSTDALAQNDVPQQEAKTIPQAESSADTPEQNSTPQGEPTANTPEQNTIPQETPQTTPQTEPSVDAPEQNSIPQGEPTTNTPEQNTTPQEEQSADNQEKALIVDFNMDNLTSNKEVANLADSKVFIVNGNTPEVVTGLEGHGSALKFDGTTNYINIGTAYQVKDSYTIAAWVKIDSDCNDLAKIISRAKTGVQGENEFSLYARKSNRKLEHSGADWIASGDSAVELGSWQHVAATFDGTTETLFVNGKKAVVHEVASSVDKTNTDSELLIGAGWNNDGTAPYPAHMFKGLLDELKIYNYNLTETEINELLGTIPEPGEDGDVTLPEALYEFDMNAVHDGTGANAGKKVIVNHVDNSEYLIYGNYAVDDFGIYDKSIKFDGRTSYIDIGKVNIDDKYTFAAWVNIDSSSMNSLNKMFGQDRTAYSSAPAFYFCVRNDGNIEFSVNNGKGSGNWVPVGQGAFAFNSWHHLAATNDGTQIKIYYDGNLVKTAQCNGSVKISDNPLNMLIGTGYNTAGTGIFEGHAFKGRMDDVRIYNTALTESQIKKSTDAIIDKIPPEVIEVSPKEGNLIAENDVLKIKYSMKVILGKEKPVITEKGSSQVDCTVGVSDLDDKVPGEETLVITPSMKLVWGKTYTFSIPAGAVAAENGVVNIAANYTYSVMQDLNGNAENSGMSYWVTKDISTPSSIKEENGIVTISNGLVKRTFDTKKNFLTTEYQNIYTSISLLESSALQADILLALNDQYADGDNSSDVLCDVGGTDETIPTFQYQNYSIDNSAEKIFEWQYNPIISPSYMKDTPWPAKGKALVVNYTAPNNIDSKYSGLKLQVRYEIYDGIPVICKSAKIINEGDNDVVVHRMTVEALPIKNTVKDALYLEGSLNAGDNHDRNNGRLEFIKWNQKSNAYGVMRHHYAAPSGVPKNGTYASNEVGPNYRLTKNAEFKTYRLYELFYSSSYFEWQSMELKKMYRTLFPQALDAPLIYHIISSDETIVKNGIDQAASAGFNMVLLSFGSGVNTEDTSAGNIEKYKRICDYAHAKNILVGAYMMQVARGGDADSTYYGGWGKMRCTKGKNAVDTQNDTLEFIDKTGLNCIEVDGIYPGTCCTNSRETHLGADTHEGQEDSIVKQWEYGVDEFYRELRARNVYINSPDWNYMNGANMAVMGYLEAGFNVSRQRQLIYSREMAYHSTFGKTPAMGWTLVPLSPYQGGDESSFWPYNERIQEYDFITGINMMYGVVGSYRGGHGLYQEGAAQNVMQTWGAFYNKYRDILGEDIIHVKPPLAESDTSLTTKDIDGFIHASNKTEQKALGAFFNQTTKTVTQKVKIPLFYTGLTNRNTPPAPVEGSHYRKTKVWSDMIDMPPVPVIPKVSAEPTDKKAYVCIGDMNGKEYPIDSNGDIEIELTMEPNTYTWFTVYDPNHIPEDVLKGTTISAPANLHVKSVSSNKISLIWDVVQIDDRDVKEYHIYRDGAYIGKTFTNQYDDTTVTENQNYEYQVVAVHNTVAGKTAVIKISTTSDTVKPQIESVKALSKTQVQVTFNENMNESNAIVPSNYGLAGNTVISSKFGTDPKTVILTLGSALPAFTDIVLTVSNVTDSAGNTIADQSQAKFVFGYLREFAFEEENGNIALDKIGGFNGNIAGNSVIRKTGVLGNGLYFDGKNNFVDVGDIVKELNEYSIHGWFNPEDVQNEQSIIAQQRDSFDGWRWNLFVKNGELRFVVNNGKGSYPGFEPKDEIAVELGSGSHQVTANQWSHFAVVRNNDTFVLYLNGKKVDVEAKLGIDQSQSLYTMWIGGCRNAAGGEAVFSFKGTMDEMKFFNTILNDIDIKKAYDENPKEDLIIKEVIHPNSINVAYGTLASKLDLPKTVTVGLGNSTTQVPVTWNTNSFNGNKAGTYILTGTLLPPSGIINSNGLTAKITVIVEKKHTEQPNKNALLALIKVAKEKAGDSNYTQASRDALTKTIATSQAVADNENATELDIANAQKALQDALDALVKQNGSDKPKNENSSASQRNKQAEQNLITSSEISNKIAQSGTIASINVTKDYKMTTAFLSDLMQSKEKSLILNGDWYSWTFDGKNIENNMPGVVWFDTTISTDSPNARDIAKLVGEADTTNIHFSYDGQLPGKTVIRVHLEEYANKLVYVYYYNPVKGRLELIQSEVKADQNGWVEFTITHCCDYVISAVAIKGAVTVKEPVASGAKADIINPETGGNNSNTAAAIQNVPAEADSAKDAVASDTEPSAPEKENFYHLAAWGCIFLAAAVTSIVAAKRKSS